MRTVNPRTFEPETPEWIAERAEIAAGFLGRSNVFLNPDCGFGTFADRPVSSAKIAARKLEALAQAAKNLRRGAL